MPAASAARFESASSDSCIVRRQDGMFVDAAVLGSAFMAAFDSVLRDDNYFTGIDYPVLIKLLYGHGPDLPRTPTGELKVRFASGIAPLPASRRALYRSVMIDGGVAAYYFEPVYLEDPANPDAPPLPARLDIDEFIADLWHKGIRFGIAFDAVRASIESGQSGRIVVARRLEPVPGTDAAVIEVSDDIHRSDAPRQLASGKLDLMSFQNRFPQIDKGVRLLKKMPRSAGVAGVELSGIVVEPDVPADLDLGAYCGVGTVVQRTGEGEFVVSQQAGFLAVDAQTSQLSVADKIVSHDGVSARTTGNLQLTGDYEEFGEVQEKRVIEGEGIVVHADVFGQIVSRGGAVLLNRNLVGGSAHNKRGDIRVNGVASGAVIQASCGEVVLQRAENCVVSGTRVSIEHAINCEIIGDDVTVGQAEGCAIAGRHVSIGIAAPRRQSEMLVYTLRPDCETLDRVIGQIGERLAQLNELAARRKAGMERQTAQPDVSKYVSLAARIRKGELTPTPEQAVQFRKMGAAVAPALKAIGQLSQEIKATLADRQAGMAVLAKLEQARSEGEGAATVEIRSLQGDTQVRMLVLPPDGSSAYDLAPREIKARLRGAGTTGVLFAGSRGEYRWSSEDEDA
jgi:hypothetical protein